LSLGRRVALKVLPPHVLSDTQQVQRFEREAKAAARLHHTNIVPVYGVGCHEGTHYYVMQFIAGLGLDGVLEELGRMRLSQVQAAPAVPVASGLPVREPVKQLARSLATGSFEHDALPSGDRPDPAGSAVTRGDADSTLPRLPDGSDLSNVTDFGARYCCTVARIGIQVAGALDYAHGQGILHRDIKPSNLLMDMRGTVWVTDFGLAKGEEGENLTRTGDIVGTVRYMAPERFQGHGDVRADVYALGLTLYELLALRPAFVQRDRAKLMQQVLHEEPPRLRTVNPAVPRDLETVIEKATAKEPGQRYKRPADLAADLQRFLDDRPILARRVQPAERLWRWTRRNPLVSGLVALVLLVTVLGFAGVLFQWQAAIAGRNEAAANENTANQRRQEVQRVNAELVRSRDRLRKVLYDTDANLIQAAWELNKTQRFLQLLDSQRPDKGEADLRDFEWYYWQRLGHAEERSFRVVAGGPNPHVEYMEFCPEGKRLAVASLVFGRGQRPGFDPTVTTWDLDTGTGLRTLHLGPMTMGPSNLDQQLQLSHRGTRLSTLRGSGPQSELAMWDLTTGTQLTRVQFPALARRRCLAFSADGERVAISYATGPAKEPPSPHMLAVHETATGRALFAVPVPCYRLQWLVFSPNGKRLAGMRNENTATEATNSAQVWDAMTGKELLTIPHLAPTLSLAFSPDGRLLATGGNASGPARAEANVWDLATGRHVFGVHDPTGSAFHVLFSPDSKRLGVVRSTPPTAMVWEIDPARPERSRLPLLRITGHLQQIAWLAFSPDSRQVYSADRGGTVKLWDTAPRAQPFDLAEWVNRPPNRIANFVPVLSPDGSRVAVVHPYGPGITQAGITVFDSSGSRLGNIGGLPPVVWPGSRDNVLAFSADGRRIATRVSADGTTPSGLQVCDSATGKQLAAIQERDDCSAVGLSADGRLVTAALTARPAKMARRPAWPSLAHGFKVWDAATGNVVLAVEANGVHAHAFSNDSRYAAWIMTPVQGQPGCEVRVWNTRTGQEMSVLRKQLDTRAGSVIFSPDGRQLAVLISPFGQQSSIRLWDAATGEDRATLIGEFQHFTFSPNGRRIATSWGMTNAPEGEIKLWDTATGREVLTLKTSGRRAQVAFNKDGHRLFALKNFNVDPGDLVEVWDTAPLPDFRDLLTGKRRPASNQERLQVISMCKRQERYAAAARFYQQLFAADPTLADDPDTGRRYDAACCNILAAAGLGADAGHLGAQARAALRQEALTWLRADLKILHQQLESGKPPDRIVVQAKLRTWQKDSRLDAIRDPDALVKMPDEHRAACQEFWADVQASLKKATQVK
jgi:WD40 repeat protein